MRQVLEFVFSDAWHFLGCCVFLMIIGLWKPIEVNVMNGYFKEDKDDADK